MALSGLTVLCGYAGLDDDDRANAVNSGVSLESVELINRAAWSEEPASDTTTTNSAASAGEIYGKPVFRIYSSADAWVSVGPSPNPSASPRHFVAANQYYDIMVKDGDKLRWIAA